MAQTPSVHSGLGPWDSWLDYGKPSFLQRNWTLSNYHAGVITNLVAVVITLAAPRLFLLVQRVCDLKSPKHPGRVQTHDSEGNCPSDDAGVGSTSTHSQSSSGQSQLEDARTGQPDDRQLPEARADDHSNLLESQESRIDEKGFMQAFLQRETPQAASLELLQAAVAGGRTWGRRLLCLFISILCLIYFIAITIGAIYSVGISSEPISLSASEDCGLWVLDESVTFLSQFNYMQEKEAGDYANRCYNTSSGSDGCNFFVAQNIDFEEQDGASCPFANGFCLEDDNAYTLSTGLVSSRELGINVPKGYAFNRTTTCSPIQRTGYVGVDDLGLIEYYYGPIKGLSPGDLTWTSFPNYPTWSGPGYQVEPFCSLNADGGWNPIPEFLPQENHQITLMLVSSQRNFHREERLDPIFPAKSMLRVGSEILYLNRDPIATVLACSDRTEICDDTGATCWDASEKPLVKPQNEIELNGLVMLQLALARSNICHSILYRGGAALDASSKIIVYQSLKLAAEQWKVEARNLLATSLARIQIDLRDHIRGAAAHEPGFINILDPRLRGICDQYKFKSSGWTNISVWGFSLVIAASIVLFALTFQLRDPAGQVEKRTDKLLIELLFFWGLSLLAGFASLVVFLASSVKNFLQKLFGQCIGRKGKVIDRKGKGVGGSGQAVSGEVINREAGIRAAEE